MKKVALFSAGMLLVIALFAAIGKGREARELAKLPLATSTPIIELQDGDVYELTADYVVKEIDGVRMKMLAYNGSIPGPTITVHEGDTVTIRFTNKTGMKTLLHAHGVRMDNPYDGSQFVQREMEDGETFDYKLRFDDPGLFWYHPHVREDKQQPLGLYGAFHVIPKNPNFWPGADREEVVFLSDILIEDGKAAPYSEKYVTHALMGRFGNTILMNGATHQEYSARPGEVIRFYFANAAAVRPFNVAVNGATMKLVGADNGPYERETFVESVLISPSERAVVDVHFPSAGTYTILHRTPNMTYTLGTVNVSGESLAGAGSTFERLRTDQRLSVEFSALRKNHLLRSPNKKLRLTLDVDMDAIMALMGSNMGAHDHGGHDHGAMMGHGHAIQPIEWEDEMGDMNTFSTSDTTRWIIRDEDTGKENTEIAWKFKRGDLVKIRISNDPASAHPMQHPFHFHGNRFVVLARDGIPETNMVWKDTTLIKTGETIDLLLETTNPGKWMAHCHIAEHLHSGMMMGYDVE